MAGQQLGRGCGHHLVEGGDRDTGSVDVPPRLVDGLVPELEAVLDGEPGVRLVPAQLGRDLLEDVGLQRLLVPAPRSRPRSSSTAPLQQTAVPCRSSSRIFSIQRGGRPVASTSGTPSSRQRSSSARVASLTVSSLRSRVPSMSVAISRGFQSDIAQPVRHPAPPPGSGRRRRRRARWCAPAPPAAPPGARWRRRPRARRPRRRRRIIGRSLGMSPNTSTSPNADAVPVQRDLQPGGLGDAGRQHLDEAEPGVGHLGVGRVDDAPARGRAARPARASPSGGRP